MITLITGGIKSGKSARALVLAREFARPIAFIATAEALDDEMRLRIARHQQERGEEFLTIEEPLEIHQALAKAGKGAAILDCLPLWVNNLVYYKREDDFHPILDAFIANLKGRDCVIVTNETGLGNVPADADSRRYNLLLAEAGRKIAAAADAVELMVLGIPLKVK